MTEGQQSLLFAISAAIESFEGEMSSEQRKELAAAVLYVRLPLIWEDSVEMIMKLDDLGFNTVPKEVQAFINAL